MSTHVSLLPHAVSPSVLIFK